jgi:protein phosphatase
MPDAALPEVQSMRLQHDDIVLLCTDGLTGMLSDEQIAESVRWDVPLDETCSLLVASANDAGGEDNVTVVLVRLEAS